MANLLRKVPADGRESCANGPLGGLPVAARSFVVASIVVPTTTYLLTPMLHRAARDWLSPRSRPAPPTPGHAAPAHPDTTQLSRDRAACPGRPRRAAPTPRPAAPVPRNRVHSSPAPARPRGSAPPAPKRSRLP